MINLSILMTIISPYTALVPTVLMVYSIYKNKMYIYINPLNIGIFLIFCCSLTSGLFNRDKLSVIASFVLLLYLGLSVYIQNNYTDEKKVEELIHKILILSIIPVIIGIFEKIASFYFDMTWISHIFWSPTYLPTKEAYRIYSTLGNPNMAGGFFAFILLICIYFIQKSSGKMQFIYSCFALLIIISIIFTGSKGTMLGLLMSILTYAVFAKNKKTRIILISAFLLLLILGLMAPVMNHAINSRASLWHKCLVMYNEKPLFGWGLFGIFNKTNEIHGHNILITILTTLGSLGLCIYLTIKLYLFKSIITLYTKNSELVPLLAAIQILIIGHGLVDFTLLLPQGGMIFFVSTSIISSLERKYNYHPALDLSKIPTILKPVPYKL